MAFPTGWGRKCALVISTTNVDADLTDFTVILTQATLPSEMLDADGSYPALADGGDIRFSSDSAGSTRLACDIRTFTRDNNPANAVAEIAVECNLSGSADTTIYIWYNKASESQPAVGDTYGQYDAYDSNYTAVYSLNEDPSGSAPQILNRKANANNGTSAGTMTSGDSISGPVGKALDFDGTDDTISFPVTLAIPTTGTFSCLWKPIDAPPTGVFWRTAERSPIRVFDVCVGDGSTNVTIGWYNNGTDKRISDTPANLNLTQNNWHHIGLAWTNGGDTKFYVNSALEGSTASLNATWDTSSSADEQGLAYDYYQVGGGSTYYIAMQSDELRISSSSRSAAWIKAEYYNLLDTANFVTEGTPETPGGTTTTRNLIIGGGVL